MFGINIRIGKISRNSFFIDDGVDTVLKRADERKIFRQFLNSEDSEGYVILSKLLKSSEEEAEKQINSGQRADKNTLLEFAVSSLKTMAGGHLNLYDSFVRKIIEDQSPEFKMLHDLVDKNKFDGKLPFGYPDVSKRAAGILVAKIKDSLESIEPEYLKRKFFNEKVRGLAKEMFHGINKLGLEGKELVSYLKIIFEISEIEICEPIVPFDFKNMIARAITVGETINLTHIKCLRFIYPKSGGVQILTDIGDVVVDGVTGKYIPKSEKNLFLRLKKVNDIFKKNGISTNFNIVIADDDLDLLFPAESVYVSQDNLEKAKREAMKYINFIKEKYANDFSFTTISSLISKNSTKYFSFRETVLKDIKNHGAKFVNPDFFEKDRVDHQYFYYQQLFGSDYSRAEARRSIAEQTASTIALKELVNMLGGNILLVEENRGGDNKLIANGTVPIIFTKLRDEAKFDVE